MLKLCSTPREECIQRTWDGATDCPMFPKVWLPTFVRATPSTVTFSPCHTMWCNPKLRPPAFSNTSVDEDDTDMFSWNPALELLRILIYHGNVRTPFPSVRVITSTQLELMLLPRSAHISSVYSVPISMRVAETLKFTLAPCVSDRSIHPRPESEALEMEPSTPPTLSWAVLPIEFIIYECRKREHIQWVDDSTYAEGHKSKLETFWPVTMLASAFKDVHALARKNVHSRVAL
mmetsp:Transcript_7705/g.12289  ORF Transcript_7705/g.12289 Transcript_7705/m.12289 type:complete len:233 (+) Transcript_7705:16125-16823(+)